MASQTNHVYHSELGETADLTKLITSVDHIGSVTFVKCLDRNGPEVAQLFRQLRIRPTSVPTNRPGVTGFRLTDAAWSKLAPLGVCNIEALL